jgi:assimilatory nitrate reductase catalytic subunit
VRDPAAPGGFRPIGYQDAIAKVATEIERIQSAHGAAARSVLSGASFTTEKTILMGECLHARLKRPKPACG